MTLTRPWIVLALALMLSACAGTPELVSRPGPAPAGVDFSGLWTLRGESGSPLAKALDAEQTIEVPRRSAARMPDRRRSEIADVRVFLESGQELKISQTPYSLFIAFDRAIVEEFTFGENRVVEVGPIEAQRVSGWDGATFVVETMDRKGTLLTERWRFMGEGDTLLRELTIMKGGQLRLSTRQEFEQR